MFVLVILSIWILLEKIIYSKIDFVLWQGITIISRGIICLLIHLYEHIGRATGIKGMYNAHPIVRIVVIYTLLLKI